MLPSSVYSDIQKSITPAIRKEVAYILAEIERTDPYMRNAPWNNKWRKLSLTSESFAGESNPAQKNVNVRTYLNVPYSEKDHAKALGARWDPAIKKWYCEGDTKPFLAWMNKPTEKAVVDRRPTTSTTITLDQYLLRRDCKAKVLTAKEARLLSIPYPLKSGWIKRHKNIAINRDLEQRLAAARNNH